MTSHGPTCGHMTQPWSCLWSHDPVMALPVATWPSHGGEVRLLVGFLWKKTLHWGWVTLVVCNDACSGSAWAGHHCFAFLLMTALAKLRSLTEWASPPESLPTLLPFINPLYADLLRLKARTASSKEGWQQHRDWGHHQRMTSRATEADTIFNFYNAVIDEDSN